MKITKQQYEELVNSLETRKRDNGEEFICKKDGLSEEVKEIINDVLFNMDYHDLDLSYKILSSALYALGDIEYESINEDFNAYDIETEFASLYNAKRLSYLNIWNEDEMREYLYNGSISEACAQWYNNKVQNIINEIINKIK